MIKRIIIILGLSILVFGCNGFDRPKKPDNLISKNQMTDLLYDLYVINAAKGVNRKILENNNFNPENYILDKYNIDSTQFADSNRYYAFDTETYSAIVEKVRERLESKMKVYEEIQERKDDSIQKQKDSINEKRNRIKDSIKENHSSTDEQERKAKSQFGIKDSLR